MAEVRFHPAAADDLNAAFNWYFERSHSAASTFVYQFEDAITRISENPNAWPHHLNGTRRFILRVFPFQVIYLNGSRGIEVVAVAHDKRKPGYWKSRVTAI